MYIFPRLGRLDFVCTIVEMNLVYVYALASTVLLAIIANIVVRVVPVRSANVGALLGYLSALAVGSLLGDAFIYLIPKVAETGWTVATTVAILVGVLSMIIAEQMITWDDVRKNKKLSTRNHVAISNMFGFTSQSFIDGLVIAGAYGISVPIGVATTLAVVIHQIPQEISNFVILRRAGIAYNLSNKIGTLAVMVSFVGAILGLLLPTIIHRNFMDLVAPFTAGVFLYVSIGQLLPGMLLEKSYQKGLAQVFLIILGVLVIATVKYSKNLLGALD